MSARICCILAAALLAVCAPAVHGQGTGFTPRVDLSGFMDVQWDADADPSHRLGQAELSATAEIAPLVGVCLAPAWDPDSDAFGVGTATINIQFGEGDLGNFCRERHTGHTGILAGRFDVPFGIDWMLYPSIDRPLVSTPLPVAAGHGAWNADGVLVYGAKGPFNGMLHSTNGFAHERPRPAGDPVSWSARRAVGGRVGLVPGAGSALGFSIAALDGRQDDPDQRLWGVDFAARRGPLAVRGEYLNQRWDGAAGARDEGWYLAARWDFGSAYGIARWDVWQAEDAARDRRLSLGAGVPVRGALVLRGEYEWWPDADRADRLVLQLAAAFGS